MPYQTQSADTPVSYVVRASCGSASLRTSYVQWLVGSAQQFGHMAEVLGAGALTAEVVTLDRPEGAQVDETWIAEARYTFRNRAALESYLAEHAPRLRVDGLAKFGPQGSVGSVLFARFTGELVRALP